MIEILIFTSYIILFIDLVLFSVSFFRKKEVNAVFFMYLLFCMMMQISLEVIFQMGFHNVFLSNVFFVGQLLLLGCFFKSLFVIPIQKKVINGIMLFNLLFAIAFFGYNIQFFFEFNLSVIAITTLSVVLFASMHLYNQLTSPKSYYYFTIGLVLYSCASVVFYLTGNLTNSWGNEFAFITWTINTVFLLVYYIFILYEWKESFAKKKMVKN